MRVLNWGRTFSGAYRRCSCGSGERQMSLGYVFGAVVGGYVAQHYGGRVACLGVGAPGIAMAAAQCGAGGKLLTRACLRGAAVEQSPS
jgi:hypothetical protein